MYWKIICDTKYTDLEPKIQDTKYFSKVKYSKYMYFQIQNTFQNFQN